MCAKKQRAKRKAPSEASSYVGAERFKKKPRSSSRENLPSVSRKGATRDEIEESDSEVLKDRRRLAAESDEDDDTDDIPARLPVSATR